MASFYNADSYNHASTTTHPNINYYSLSISSIFAQLRYGDRENIGLFGIQLLYYIPFLSTLGLSKHAVPPPFLKARMRGLKRKKLIACFNKEVNKKK